ncbi:MAG: nucleoside-diphosphate kinase [Phycisphaerae bacterium]|nr:nucleoside-diphosphate kinase [Phycisphaerae bacterium]
MQRTLVVLKPDAVQRQLVGRIIQRFETKGLKLVGLRMVQVTPAQAGEMYLPHKDKDFYQPLVKFITASPVVVMVLEGVGAIGVARDMMGPTFGPDAPPGTIRGDFGMSRRYNLIHGSDSPEAAAREISLFFEEKDLLEYDLVIEQWEYSEIDQ